MTTYSTAGTAFTAIEPVLPLLPHPYWTQARVARALGTGPSASWPFGGVSTDTRHLTRGDLFVALRGEHYDAHDFLGQARDYGAAAFVVSDATKAAGLGRPVYVVPDTLVAFMYAQRAEYHFFRKQYEQALADFNNARDARVDAPRYSEELFLVS